MSANNKSHANGEHHDPPYMKVFLLLFALTVFEVGISYIMIPAIRPFIVGMLLLIGVIKAAFVALYYMHLKDEGKLIYGTAILPIVWAAIMIVTVTLDVYAADFSKVIVKPSQQPSAHGAHGGGDHGSSSGGHSSSSASAEEDEWGGGEEESYFEDEPAAADSSAPEASSDDSSPAGAVSVKYYQGLPGGTDYITDDPSFYN